MTPEDIDGSVDIYERAGGVTTRVSTGPNGGNWALTDASLAAVSADGSRVFFETDEALTPDDLDGSSGYTRVDVYERAGGVTTRVSTGPTDGNGAFDASLDDISDDGTRAFFRTQETLTTDDVDTESGIYADTETDIYERFNGVTSLISTGPTDAGATPAPYPIVSRDGTRVLFVTGGRLTTEDTDGSGDIYERVGGVTRLISTGPNGGSGNFSVSFYFASSDCRRVFFNSKERLTPDDQDNENDVYQRGDGVTARVSTGPVGGNGPFFTSVTRVSEDGSRVFFETAEPLTPDDIDAGDDAYERAGNVTTRVSTGPGGGNGPYYTNLNEISADGTRVFFETYESLTSDDRDIYRDLYERAGGVTTLLSVGPSGGSGPFDPNLAAVSEDGARAFFDTPEKLVSDDADAEYDVYAADPPATPIQPSATPALPSGELSTLDRSAPILRGFRLERPRFRVARGATPRVARTRSYSKGSAFRYRLSELARVSITLERRVASPRRSRRCLRRGGSRQKPRCPRYVPVGRLTRSGRQGSNRHPFTGRIGLRALRQGNYRATIVATDSAGNRSRPKRAQFRITRP